MINAVCHAIHRPFPMRLTQDNCSGIDTYDLRQLVRSVGMRVSAISFNLVLD